MTAWTAYRVILRLNSPMHIGYTEVGYLRRTRPYVTGRVLRGALVSRVGRNQNIVGDEAGDPYRPVSKTFAQYLTFTYFYPALKSGNDYQVQFPWDDEALFRRRFLSSYAGTALTYPQQSAAEGLLREIECISPYTLDEGKPVYLMGYVFVQEGCVKKYDWCGGFARLQLGGERGYGWGKARLERCDPADKIFYLESFDLDQKRPILHLKNNDRLLAHTLPQNIVVTGRVEPMVGREWRGNNKDNNHCHIGQHIIYNGIYYSPGAKILVDGDFVIGEAGYWQYHTSLEGKFNDGLDHV